MSVHDDKSLKFTRDGNGVAVRQYHSGGPVLSLTFDELEQHINAVKAGKLDYLIPKKEDKKEKAPAK